MIIVLFILLPVVAFILSLKDLRRPQNAIVFISFYALFGYCQHFELLTADITGIGWVFQHASVVDAWETFKKGDTADMYRNFLFMNVLPFSRNPKVLCAVAGLIYGLLSYFLFVKIYKLWSLPRNKYFYLFILIVISNISLVHLTGLRFFTGGQLLALSAINYCEGRKLWLIGVLICPFIHFALFAGAAAFFIYFFFKRFFLIKRVSIVVLTMAFLVSFANLKSMAADELSNADIENSTMNTKLNAYTGQKSSYKISTSTTSAYRQANSIFTNSFQLLSRLGLFVLILYFLRKLDIKKLSSLDKNLLTLSVVFCTISCLGLAVTPHFMRFINLTWAIFFIFLASYGFMYLKDNFNRVAILIFFFNFYSVAFLLINAPRLVTPDLWFCPLPYLIYEGINFRITLI